MSNSIFNSYEVKTEELLKKYRLFKKSVDVESLAKKLGAELEYKDLDDDVSGFLVKKDGVNFIGINKHHPKVRQRFTISHEIGHLNLHVDTPLFVDYYKGSTLYRSDNKPANYRMEKEANSYAACLLMPEKLVEEELDLLDENLTYDEKLYKLSFLFEVSTQAMDYRLKALGHYDYGFY